MAKAQSGRMLGNRAISVLSNMILEGTVSSQDTPPGISWGNFVPLNSEVYAERFAGNRLRVGLWVELQMPIGWTLSMDFRLGCDVVQWVRLNQCK